MALGEYLSKPHKRIGSQTALAACGFQFRRVEDVVNLSVCSFEHKVAAAGLASGVLLPMYQDPAFQCGDTAKVEHRQGEALIGHQDSMRRQRFLTVGASLHGS